MMLERQREGIAKAKADKKYKGRAPTARAKADEIKALASQGISKREIAQKLGLGERSVFRVPGVLTNTPIKGRSLSTHLIIRPTAVSCARDIVVPG